MEHLAEEYGVIDIAVRLVAEEEDCIPIHSPAEFYGFPKKNGWSVRATDYALIALDEVDESTGAKRLYKSDFLQSWLFFGLISFIVQDEQGPILKFEDLQSSNYGELWLDTSSLPGALKKWETWEIANPESAKLRMVRIELALDFAHRVVQKNCAFDAEDSEGDQSVSPGDPNYLSDKVSLSLMVLGETLTVSKARIIDNLGTQMRGWHKDDEGGWGPPRYVHEEMTKRKWCPRTIHLLEGQLGSNATLLLTALESQSSYGVDDIHQRKGCDKDTCLVISGDDEYPREPETSQDGPTSRYRPEHQNGCRKIDCRMVGPDMDEVFEILREQDDINEGQRFPIIEIREAEDKTLGMVVVPWTADQNVPFATVSHVWSDGLGNEEMNGIYYCQLKFISNLLTKVVQSRQIGQRHQSEQAKTIPFWMDTLLIPVRNTLPGVVLPLDFDDLKKRAIRQIHDVFNASTHSIVIDRGLLSVDSRGTPWKNVMRILASGWMRRLWTLQEAFLSRKLWITFEQGEASHAGMRNLDELIGEMVTKETLGSSIAEMARLKLFQNIMGHERNERNERNLIGEAHPPGGAILVANTWRAARWRTTSNPAHETLALATLLNLKYHDTTINQAGLTDRRDIIENAELGYMMRDFWRTLNTRFPGSIPPGIIFLPGDRLSEPGFRWAPRTWMSAVEIDHPDPLSAINSVAELESQGLLVQYPGFLLHCQDKRVILATDHTHPTFTFPIDRGLLEWYSVEPADKDRKQYLYQILEQPKGKPPQLAIILSRSRPRERPPEIGLLVEIYSKDPRKGEGFDPNKEVYWCHIIHRVRVSRTKPLYGHGHFGRETESENFHQGDGSGQSDTNRSPSILGAPSPEDSQICIGELVSSNQQWCVDSFEPPKPEEPLPKDPKQSGASEIPTEAASETPVPPKNGGSSFFQALSMLWQKNPNSQHAQSDPTSPPPPSSEETGGTTDAQHQKLKSRQTFSAGSSSSISQRLLPRSWTGLH